MADREDVGLIVISICFVVVVGGAAGIFYLRQSATSTTRTPATPYGAAMPNQNPNWAWTSPEQLAIDQFTAPGQIGRSGESGSGEVQSGSRKR